MGKKDLLQRELHLCAEPGIVVSRTRATLVLGPPGSAEPLTRAMGSGELSPLPLFSGRTVDLFALSVESLALTVNMHYIRWP